MSKQNEFDILTNDKLLNEDLNNLLAIIHRDGGHHTQEVGEKQSIVDAIQVWIDRQTEIENLKTKIIGLSILK